MPDNPQWIDLCDPDEETVRAVLPAGIHDTALNRIMGPARTEPRPRLQSQGDYVFGVLAFPAVSARGDLVFQEVDLIANLDVLVTVRKTPEGRPARSFPGTLSGCRVASRATALRRGRAVTSEAARPVRRVSDHDRRVSSSS